MSVRPGGLYQKIKKIHIVYGPPCSGKSTWVYGMRQQRDFVWDLDAVVSAVSGRPPHTPKCVGHLDAVLAMQDAVFDYLAGPDSKVLKAWIIITNPSNIRKKFRGASFYLIETPLEVCIERARADGRSGDVLTAIHRWFRECRSEPGDAVIRGWQ